MRRLFGSQPSRPCCSPCVPSSSWTSRTLLRYTFTLFSVAACANLFGLIISLLFNSVRVIYLAIPLFIIPQLMLGGAIVPFSAMHPGIARTTAVPWPAQTMISRWGFEALATMYAADNAFTRPLYQAEQGMAQAEFLRDRWVPEMKSQLREAQKGEDAALKRVAKGCATQTSRFRDL